MSDPAMVWPRSARYGLAAVFFSVVGLAVVIGVRTETLVPVRIADVVPPSAPPIDAGPITWHLSEAIAIRTVASDFGAATDPAALATFHRWLIRTYPRFHAAAHCEPVGAGTLVYAWPGTDRTLAPIVFMAHQDVVPAGDPARWHHPPFAGVIAQGKVWGRGSVDDKGSLVALFEAAETLIAHGVRPKRDILIVLGHDEETSGSGARAAAALLARRGVRAAFVLDEGSFVIRDHPVTHAPVALIAVAEKGFATIAIRARSPGGHASAPPDNTAVEVLAKAILAITGHPYPLVYDGSAKAMMVSLAQFVPTGTRVAIANDWLFAGLIAQRIGRTPQGAAMLHTTIAPTMLTGSQKVNVLADEATVTINFRIAPGDSVGAIVSRTRALVADLPVDVRLVGVWQDPSPASDTSSASYRTIAGLAQRFFEAPAAPFVSIAATDSRSMTKISGDIYRFEPLTLTLDETRMIHGFDESIRIGDLVKMASFYEAAMLYR